MSRHDLALLLAAIVLLPGAPLISAQDREPAPVKRMRKKRRTQVGRKTSPGFRARSPESLGLKLLGARGRRFKAKVVDPGKLAEQGIRGARSGEIVWVTARKGSLDVERRVVGKVQRKRIGLGVAGAAGSPAGGASMVSEMAQMNMQFLALQNAVQMETRKYKALSNASRARHDAAMNSIRNMR